MGHLASVRTFSYLSFLCVLQDGGALSALRSMLTELQGEQEKLNSKTEELVEEHNRKQKHIDVSFHGACHN